jgi:hypothetical protein
MVSIISTDSISTGMGAGTGAGAGVCTGLEALWFIRLRIGFIFWWLVKRDGCAELLFYSK